MVQIHPKHILNHPTKLTVVKPEASYDALHIPVVDKSAVAIIDLTIGHLPPATYEEGQRIQDIVKENK